MTIEELKVLLADHLIDLVDARKALASKERETKELQAQVKSLKETLADVQKESTEAQR